ncbi:MAG: hypothetical protein IKF71_05370 [Bacilli bacterium]|nr:hypothetical protein [Bacilli bacterium]
MEKQYEFFIAGKFRNKDNILKICDIFDKYNISYYCFLKSENSMMNYGDKNQTQEEKMKEFESLGLKSDAVLRIFNEDIEAQRNSNNFLLVLPAGKSGHIEAGISYGMNRKCYAIGEYDATDSLYNIFEKIFEDNSQLEEFLKNYNN